MQGEPRCPDDHRGCSEKIEIRVEQLTYRHTMDADTFKQRFIPHWRHCFWVAWRLTGGTQDAEDLVQEAFLKLWMRREELNGIENDEAYLTTLVRHLYHDLWRRKHVNMTGAPIEEIQVADGDDMMGRVEAADEMEQVVRLIGKLPPQQQQIITMHGIDQLSSEEIYNQTGLSHVNIRTLLSRARKNLRNLFNKK